jgi:hypothetical protein
MSTCRSLLAANVLTLVGAMSVLVMPGQAALQSNAIDLNGVSLNSLTQNSLTRNAQTADDARQLSPRSVTLPFSRSLETPR